MQLTSRTNDDGRVPVEAISTNVVDLANSTATPLGTGAIFTGTAVEVKDISTITLLVFSDVASATDGLQVQWSTDGTNWDDDDKLTIPANDGKFFTFGPEAR